MEKISMKKVKENVIEINQTGGIESQATYHTNYIHINKLNIRGNLEVNILALIRDRENTDETSIFLEIYDLEKIKNNCFIQFNFDYRDLEKIKNNCFIQFNFDYRDLEEEDYSFNDELLKAILQTVRIQTITNY